MRAGQLLGRCLIDFVVHSWAISLVVALRYLLFFLSRQKYFLARILWINTLSVIIGLAAIVCRKVQWGAGLENAVVLFVTYFIHLPLHYRFKLDFVLIIWAKPLLLLILQRRFIFQQRCDGVKVLGTLLIGCDIKVRANLAVTVAFNHLSHIVLFLVHFIRRHDLNREIWHIDMKRASNCNILPLYFVYTDGATIGRF